MIRLRLSFLVALAVLLAACGRQHRNDMERVDSLRVGAENLVRAQSLMGFESWAYGKEANQDSLYHAHAGLFTNDNINVVRRAAEDEPDSLQKKRLRYFLRYLTTEFIAKEVAPLTDSVGNYEAIATVAVAGKSVPYRQVPSLMANEKNQTKRAALYFAQDPVLDTINTMLSRVELTSLRLARELGYASYTDMVGALKGYSLEEFRSTADEVLESTDSLYRSLLAEMVTRYLHLTPQTFHAYDRGPLFRNSTFDRFFPGRDMLRVLSSTYRVLGFDLDAMSNLTIDAEVRPAKNPRAVCYPVDVPSDVRLSIKPIGGFDDYSALFHEMGHALHYASTRERSFEFRYAGDPTVTETYAFLSEYLLTNQAWLRTRNVMQTPVLKDFVRFQAFYRLWYVRRYCAKFLYEVRLHGGESRPDTLYAALMSKAIGVVATPSEGRRYLTDVDALYYSAGYLRAWFLESQLNARLSATYGTNWFEYPKAGEFLRSLWAFGDRLDGEELVHSVGERAIAPTAWLAEIKAMVLFSSK